MKNKISDEHSLFAIIKDVLNYEQNPDVPVAVESMDDCALIKISDTHSLAVSSDFIRGSGFYLFELGLLNYFDVGYYLIAANLSDIASMGAEPIGLTTVIRYADMDDNDFRNVFEGMKLAADNYNTRIIGGDIGGHKADVFVATAFGRVKTSEALLRKSVKDGDLLCVTGSVGRPITALTYFKEVKKLGFSLLKEEEESILLSWKRPTPRINEGLLLSGMQLANACQDVSDGLKATIEQMSELSGKTFSIFSHKLPIEDTTIKLATFLEIDPVQIAISASVDFELLFTISSENKDKCLEKFAEHGYKMTIIGEVNKLGRNVLLDSDNREKELPGTVWKQQQSDNYLKQIIGR